MRLFSFKNASGYEGIGALSKHDMNSFIDLSATDPRLPNQLQKIIASPSYLELAKHAISKSDAIKGQLQSITFKPPIESPGKIVCMGLNYADHAKEGGNARPEYPSFFMRGPSSLTAHLSPIIRPKVSDKLD